MAIKILATMGLNKTGFDAGLRSVNSQVTGFASSLKGQLAAAVGIGAIAAGFKNAASEAGKLRDMAEGLGVSIETLQERGFAMRQGSGTVEDYQRALIGLARAREAITKGGTGADDLVQSFNALGVSVDDLESKGLDELFLQIGKRVQEVADVQTVAGDALVVMGKAGAKTLPAMRAGLLEAAEQAREFGVVMREEVAQDVADLANEFDALKDSLTPLFAGFLSGFNKVLPYIRATAAGTAAAFKNVFTLDTTQTSLEAFTNAAKDSFVLSGKQREAALAARAARQSVRTDLFDLGEFQANAPGSLSAAGGAARKATAPSLTALQQIGAEIKTGRDPMAEKSLRLQRMIAENTKATADAVKNGGAAFP